jgi:hypothetical protein
MAVYEIERGRWGEFLDEFSRAHRAWQATVERVSPLGPTCVEVSNEPLQSVAAAVSDTDASEIGIEFQRDGRRAPTILIQGPQHLRVDEEDGSIQSLEIADTNNVVTRIRFRVPAPPAMLDGVAPGELS